MTFLRLMKMPATDRQNSTAPRVRKWVRVNMNFIAFSHFNGDVAGQVFVFFILTVAAAEAAIGLAILVVLFRNRSSINVEDLDAMKG